MAETRCIWHYTTKPKLDLILAKGVIRPATDGVPPGEKPVVWFSANEQWEETASKGVVEMGHIRYLTRQETHQLAGGLARIEVAPSTAPYSWHDFLNLSGINPRDAKALYRVAIGRQSHPGEWFVSFEPVPVEK